MLRIFALILALVAVACMCVAIIGMVTGRPSDRAGWAWRLAALIAFAGVVALNIAAH